MKKIIIPLVICVISYACSKEISNGPIVEFNNQIFWNDTVKEDENVQIAIKAFSVDAPINEIEIQIDDMQVYDTICKDIDSINFIHSINFFENKGEHIVKIIAKDSKGLLAIQSKKVFVQLLKSPTIQFNTNFVFKDTITAIGNNLDFLIECTKGERSLDSLYVLYENNVIYSYPNLVYPQMNDSFQLVPFTFIADSIGEYMLQFKIVDIANKTDIQIKNITVIQNE